MNSEVFKCIVNVKLLK